MKRAKKVINNDSCGKLCVCERVMCVMGSLEKIITKIFKRIRLEVKVLKIINRIIRFA